jgi:hypothetical protein
MITSGAKLKKTNLKRLRVNLKVAQSCRYLQTVPVEVNVAIEVHVVEGLQRDLVLPTVS